jgi:LuxR family maltose regulon positive regulatory protein
LSDVLSAGRSLAVVIAPAGYGKTTLLAEWLSGLPGLVSWVSLEADDNDPVRFVAHLSAALAALWPGSGEAALALLSAPPGRHNLKAVLGSLVNDLAHPPAGPEASAGNGHDHALGRSHQGSTPSRQSESARPRAGALPEVAVLALDDFHLITAPAVHEAVVFLIDHLPSHLRLVVASRSEPPLPLARLRAGGRLVELGLADLCFTPAEAESFLSGSMGLALEPEQAAALEWRTEGWAAGLQLAALALQGGSGAQVMAAVVTGSHRYISDYLLEEVLERQPGWVRHFLLCTSILERLEAGLCAAVVTPDAADPPGAQPGSASLDYLDRARLFVIPLDGERRWYRYHHLFAEALRAWLHRTQPALEPELHRRAARWYAAHDGPADAIRHALAARDYPSAARWIDAASDRLIRLGQFATIRGWIEALPGGIVRGDAALCVWYCWTLIDADRLAELEPLIQAAEACLRGEEPPTQLTPERQQELHGQIAVIRSQRAFRQDRPDEGVALAREALRLLSPQHVSLRSFVALSLGYRYVRQGEAGAAAGPLVEAHQAMRQVHHPFIRIQIAESLAEVHWLQGRLHAAAQVCTEALALAGQHGLEALTVELRLRLGLVCLEWNDLDRADQQVLALASLARRGEDAALEAHIDLFQARILQARAALVQAENLARDAAQRLAQGRELAHHPWLGAWLGRFWLVAGQVDQARAAMGWLRAAPPENLTEFEGLALARLWLAEGRPEASLALAKRIRAKAEKAGRHGSALRARLAQAAAHQALGHWPQALRVLEGALSLAAPERYTRAFLDGGPPLLALLRRLSAIHPWRPYVDRLLALAGEETVSAVIVPAASPPGSPRPIERLTAREREVLSLLAAGRSNHEIAATLVVAVGTVRWYSKQIYRKLEVHNRTQALLRAQALGLA